MKIRSGWVSNSSSSSFVFPTREEDRRTAIRQLARILFMDTNRGPVLSLIDRMMEDIVDALHEDGEFVWYSKAGDYGDEWRTDRMKSVEDFEKYLDAPIPEKFEWIRRSLDYGETLFRIYVPDGGEGGSQLQSWLRESLKTWGRELVDLDDIWEAVNEEKREMKG